MLAAAGFGGIIGAAVENALESRKCRSVLATRVVSGLAGLVCYYISWAVWLHAFTGLSTVWILNPINMAGAMLAVTEHGAWTLLGLLVKGGALWFAWFLEAVLVFGMTLSLATGTMLEATFCEGCEEWAKENEGVAFVAAGDAPPMEDKVGFKAYLKGLKQHAAALKQHLEARDLSYLEQLGVYNIAPVLSETVVAWYRLDLHSCPNCNMTHTLRVIQYKRRIEGGKVKDSTDDKEILRQLLLSSTEADAIRKMGDKLGSRLPKLAVERSRKAKEIEKSKATLMTSETLVFRASTPGLIGDVILFLILVTIIVGFFTLLHPVAGGVVFLLIAALFYANPLSCVPPERLVLDRESACIGFLGLRRRIAYESVRFLRAGGFDDRVGTRRDGGAVVLLIEAGRRKYKIYLRRTDVEAAIAVLHSRCPHASGITLDGSDFAPSDPADAVAAKRRLGRFWLWQTVLALAGTVLISFMIVNVIQVGWPAGIVDGIRISIVFAAFPAVLFYGLFALSRAREDFRSEGIKSNAGRAGAGRTRRHRRAK